MKWLIIKPRRWWQLSDRRRTREMSIKSISDSLWRFHILHTGLWVLAYIIVCFVEQMLKTE